MRLRMMILAAFWIGCEPDPGDSVPEDSQPDTTDSDADTLELEDLTGGCPTSHRVGGFELAHWDGPDEGFATATGQVNDAVIPATIRFEAGEEGACILWQKIVPYCEEACEPDEACSHDGECVPYPVPQDIGPVTISGLSAPLDLTADDFGNYWDTSLGYPLFEPGSPIELDAGDLFSLQGFGVETLVVPEPNWLLVPGEDMTVSWTASGHPAWIELTFNIDQHGLSPLTMVCEVPDTGSATLPAALLDQLVNSGVSGYPSAWMRRRTADAYAIQQGCVDLQVFSHVGVDMGVEGYTPCSRDEDCPEGQHCDMDMQICVDD